MCGGLVVFPLSGQLPATLWGGAMGGLPAPGSGRLAGFDVARVREGNLPQDLRDAVPGQRGATVSSTNVHHPLDAGTPSVRLGKRQRATWSRHCPRGSRLDTPTPQHGSHTITERSQSGVRMGRALGRELGSPWKRGLGGASWLESVTPRASPGSLLAARASKCEAWLALYTLESASPNFVTVNLRTARPRGGKR